MISFNRLPSRRRQIAIIESSAVWRHWIDRIVRPTPDVDLAIFESVRSLWLALGPRPADLVILSYRLPGFDTYAWINDRRRAASASACRIVALVTRLRQFSAGEGPYGQWNQRLESRILRNL